MRIEFDLANCFGQRALYAHCVRSHYTNIIVTYQQNSGHVFSISRACRCVSLRRACYTKVYNGAHVGLFLPFSFSGCTIGPVSCVGLTRKGENRRREMRAGGGGSTFI